MSVIKYRGPARGTKLSPDSRRRFVAACEKTSRTTEGIEVQGAAALLGLGLPRPGVFEVFKVKVKEYVGPRHESPALDFEARRQATGSADAGAGKVSGAIGITICVVQRRSYPAGGGGGSRHRLGFRRRPAAQPPLLVMRIRGQAFWLHGVRVHGVWVAAVRESAGVRGAGEAEGDASAVAGCGESVLRRSLVVQGAWSTESSVEDLAGL